MRAQRILSRSVHQYSWIIHMQLRSVCERTLRQRILRMHIHVHRTRL